MFFLSCVCYVFVRVCLYPAGKGLTSWLSFVVSNCELTVAIKFTNYSNVWRKGEWGKLLRSADAYKHCLNFQ